MQHAKASEPPCDRPAQIALLEWIREALRPALPVISGRIEFTTWRVPKGDGSDDLSLGTLEDLGTREELAEFWEPTYEGTERGLIVHAGREVMEYLLLLECGEWARSQSVKRDAERGRYMMNEVHRISTDTIVDMGWTVDVVIDALIEKLTVRCAECGDPYEEYLDAAEDKLRRNALALLRRLGQMPGVIELRRATLESRRRMVTSLGLGLR